MNNSTPTRPLTNAGWLEALTELVPEDERLLISTVPGDPEDAGAEAWNVRPWTWGTAAPPPAQNNYVCVSSFRRGPDGWRRRATEFGRAVVFMIDDLGTKVPLHAISGLAPTLLCETSPGNFQAWYLLADPIADYERFAALQRAFVARWAGGKDPGMGGPNRVGRLPQGINGKRKYNGWTVRVERYAPGRRVSVAELLEGLDLMLVPVAPRRPINTDVSEAQRAERDAEFAALVRVLERSQVFLKPAFGHNGRRPLLCPWWERHTGGAQNGTYLTRPSEQNGWWGSFVCYHSTTHNDSCHLRDLKRWAEAIEDERLEAALNQANDRG